MQFTPLKDPRGRKPIDPSKRMSARVVSIDDETAAILRSYGNGNLSQGIRDAAKEIEKKFVKTHHDEQPKQSQC